MRHQISLTDWETADEAIQSIRFWRSLGNNSNYLSER
jgi:hypothetical protein